MAVVDVPAITQLRFQQSFVEFVEVPQTQFSDRVVGSVASQRQVQCKLCQSPLSSHRCCSWTRLMTPVVVQRQVLVFDRAENCGGPAVAAVL